jgi:hypothetical protein
MPDNAVTIVAAGAPLREARGVVVMLHGRGATAEDILSLNDELGQDIALSCAAGARLLVVSTVLSRTA